MEEEKSRLKVSNNSYIERVQDIQTFPRLSCLTKTLFVPFFAEQLSQTTSLTVSAARKDFRRLSIDKSLKAFVMSNLGKRIDKHSNAS